MAHKRKVPVSGPTIDWSPWAAARFQTEDARDRFVGSIAGTQDDGWSAQVVADDGLGAQVRWRPGKFLRLNDVAYAHGGRIAVRAGRRWIA